jgi:hypothetical protein
VPSRRPELRSNIQFIIIIIIIIIIFFIIIIIITLLQTSSSYKAVYGPIKPLAPYSPHLVLKDF